MLVTVTLTVDVRNRRELRLAAEARAVSEGLTRADWRRRRSSVSDDLRMLLDPGEPVAGCSIVESSADIPWGTQL